LGLLLGHRAHQDGPHVAAGGQLVEPVHRQQRPLAAALARLDHFNGHVLVAVGQLPQLLGQHIQGDGALGLGVLMHNQLGELVLIGLATREVRDADLFDRHGCLLGQGSQQA
jgi:hypothetical protein